MTFKISSHGCALDLNCSLFWNLRCNIRLFGVRVLLMLCWQLSSLLRLISLYSISLKSSFTFVNYFVFSMISSVAHQLLKRIFLISIHLHNFYNFFIHWFLVSLFCDLIKYMVFCGPLWIYLGFYYGIVCVVYVLLQSAFYFWYNSM